ncbi:MAG TPA: peroxidase family protein [Hyphomicrobiaceae bacterium]|nr:peroxidase family protein [Hyphomicrobiaceae bacterium]
MRTGHAFLNDIAHNAVPVFDALGQLVPDADNLTGNPVPVGPQGNNLAYDDELLNAHFIAGDGRVNENIGLTAVHAIFHSEHNRLVEQAKQTIVNAGSVEFLNEWLLAPVASLPTDQAGIDALQWNGERLFQVAKFGTEMQYQHLVFEEFARTVQPNVDLFFAPTQVYDVDLDPSIVAEFAHTVYRFGHSMLTETIDRLDPEFNNSEIGLIAAFLNPLAYVDGGATPEDATSAIVRGVTRQTGNAIDEFVTEALRNNLLGLPLDLAAINIARGRDAGIPTLNAVRRDIYEQTGDSQLKPYLSWSDFVQYLKHPDSLINFIAAYGTHPLITQATTLADKRAAAIMLVFGGDGEPADRLDFLNSTGAWANGANGVTITGVDAIDLWIGGLAEEVMPFGGMLGSTFNFVFENQLEKLQDGDRFYYLERTAGLSFNAELESNSFAKMIMANTSVTHLPGVVFTTPAFTLEVDQSKQFTGLGDSGRDDPTGGVLLTPLVIRDNPDTAGPDSNYLHYTGEDHVVLGGTAGDDILLASIGDDTIWGDAGNDRIDGGDGNDQLRGGAGDDIITDTGGDDNIQGGDGNDVIHGGNGVNLIIGGFGNDFIVTGEDASEAIGGQGNDFILGSKANEQDMGNEGDDWIEGGTSDGAPGDNFDPLGNDPIIGNDVFIGRGENDKFNGEGGDDIMVGSVGLGDRYIGGSGFDWATFKDDNLGVYIDISDRFFDQPPQPGSGASVLTRFDFVEGLSGSQHADVLQGDDVDAAALATAGATGSVLTNIGLINGLQDLLGPGVTQFDGGNIILGGGGGDIIEGRGGNDLIDGDAWLNVRISVRQNLDGTGPEIASFDSMEPMIPFMLDGTYKAGQLVITREILYAAGPDYDTAVFSGVRANYTVVEAADGTVTVTDNVGTDGTDTLKHIERLQFADAVELVGGLNNAPVGTPIITGSAAENEPLTVTIAGVTDADNVSTGGQITGPVDYFWQVETVAGSGVFDDILADFAAGEVARVYGATFTPTAAEAGLRLRVRAIYQDQNGALEQVFSAPTGPVDNINDPATGVVFLSSTTPTEGLAIAAFTTGIQDLDGLTGAVFSFQWQSSADGVTWTDVGDGTALFTPTDAEVGRVLRVVVSFTDDLGGLESIASAPTDVVGDLIFGLDIAETLTGTAGLDQIFGGGGNDVLFGLAGNDELFGENGNDTLDGGVGGDAMFGGTGNDTYIVDDAADQVIELAGEGTDVVRTSLAAYALTDDVENLVYTGIGAFTGTGNARANVITGVDGADLLSGGDDNDTLNGNGGTDTLNGDAGNDILNGGAGNDILNGGTGADTLNGGGDDDTLNGGLGNDQLNGGAGIDTASYAGETANMFINLVNGTARRGTAGAPVEDNLGSIENVIGGAGNDTITSNGNSNRLDGGAGDDTLSAGGSSDVLIGGDGNDSLTGGTGNDTQSGGAGSDTFAYTIGDGADAVDGGADSDRLNILGTAAANTLDVLWNGSSITAFEGGTVTGVEQVTADLLGGTDTLSYAGSTASVSVNLATASASGLLSIAGTENVTGGSAGDFLTGNGQVNTLNGGAGNDTLDGGAGNDTLAGGAGDDTYIANNGDTITEAAGAAGGIDTVLTASANFTLTANVENLTYTGGGAFTGNGNASANVITGGTGNNTLNGAGGSDTLNGMGGNDTLNGDAGDDRLTGGVGNDTMNGGTGNDTFVFAAGFGNDVINGFDANPSNGGQDLIDLTAYHLTAATFASTVNIADVGADILITIGTDTIRLAGVSGTGVNAVTQQDFIL